MNEILDGTGYIAGDIALAVLISLSAFLTYGRIAFDCSGLKLPLARMAMGVGFTVWCLRFWYAIVTRGDVIVAPISMVAIALVCSGYSVVQLVAIRRAIQFDRHPIFCLQDPEQHCHREDRIQEALRNDRRERP